MPVRTEATLFFKIITGPAIVAPYQIRLRLLGSQSYVFACMKINSNMPKHKATPFQDYGTLLKIQLFLIACSFTLFTRQCNSPLHLAPSCLTSVLFYIYYIHFGAAFSHKLFLVIELGTSSLPLLYQMWSSCNLVYLMFPDIWCTYLLQQCLRSCRVPAVFNT